MSPSEPSHDPSSRHAFFPSADVPVSLGSSPMTTSIAAPARNPVTTAFERKLAIHPNRKSASSRNSSPVANAIAATSCAACSPPRPVTTTAPPATAASDELGPVEMCRDVAKSAYTIPPTAAAYKPFCNGTPAMSAYPRFFGTTRAVTAIPAARSLRSQRRS